MMLTWPAVADAELACLTELSPWAAWEIRGPAWEAAGSCLVQQAEGRVGCGREAAACPATHKLSRKWLAAQPALPAAALRSVPSEG